MYTGWGLMLIKLATLYSFSLSGLNPGINLISNRSAWLQSTFPNVWFMLSEVISAILWPLQLRFYSTFVFHVFRHSGSFRWKSGQNGPINSSTTLINAKRNKDSRLQKVTNKQDVFILISFRRTRSLGKTGLQDTTGLHGENYFCILVLCDIE